MEMKVKEEEKRKQRNIFDTMNQFFRINKNFSNSFSDKT